MKLPAALARSLVLACLFSTGALADDLLQPGDRIFAVGHRLASNSSYPAAEAPPNILDGNLETKYLNFAGAQTGFIVTLSGGSAPVRSMEIGTANDAESRDPATFIMYGSNDAIVSTDNSDGLGEAWTEIGSGALDLPGVRLSWATPVNIANDTSYSSYKVIFPTLKGAGETLMQIAEVELYNGAGGFNGSGSLITSSADAVLAVQDPVPTSNHGTLETPLQLIDTDPGSKYVNTGKEGTGFIVVPAVGLTRIESFVITTANDAMERDPASYELYGTVDTVVSEPNGTGQLEDWVLIAEGPLSLPAERTTEGGTVLVDNTEDYLAYKMVFPTLKDSAAANSMQIAEIQFGGIVLNPPDMELILMQGDRIVAIDTDIGSRSSYPDAEAPRWALDGFSDTKYLNFAGAGTGFIVTPSAGSTTVRSFQITTANDAPERDPSAWALYGTTDAIVSADNSTGDAENWTLIGSGTVELPEERMAVGPVVPVPNGSAYTSYRMFFTELRGGAPLMQIAEIQFYDDEAGVGNPLLAQLDPIIAVQSARALSGYGGGESPSRAVDGNLNSKYLNNGGENSGFIVMPFAPSTVLQRFSIATGNDAENRDPASYELYGSLDPLLSEDNSTGEAETWVLISSGDLDLPSARGVVSDPVSISNTTAYRTYKMIFPTIKDATAQNLMQIAEVQLRGVIEDPGPTPLLSLDDAVVAVHPVTASNSSYPEAEAPADALDGDVGTKYLNGGGFGAGFIVTPVGSPTVRSFVITTANDFPGRDPAEWALYGTNDPITSEDNSGGTNENWTLIGSGSVALPEDRQVAGPVVAVANEASYASYRMVFTSLKDNNTIMQIADIQFYDDAAGAGTPLLSASDPILAIGRVVGLSNHPAAEGPLRLLDELIGTKYLNFGAAQSGFIVTPAAGSTVVNMFVLRTANDNVERDPTSYELYGTTDPITSPNNSTGTDENWTLIASGSLDLPNARLQVGDIVPVANTAMYTSYKMIFPTLKGAGNSLQLAEAQFFGEAETVATFPILAFGRDGDNLMLQWGSQVGTDYEIYYSPDLSDWSQKLPGTISGSATTTEHTFADPMPEADILIFRVQSP